VDPLSSITRQEAQDRIPVWVEVGNDRWLLGNVLYVKASGRRVGIRVPDKGFFEVPQRRVRRAHESKEQTLYRLRQQSN
jgi:hypothetical protein